MTVGLWADNGRVQTTGNLSQVATCTRGAHDEPCYLDWPGCSRSFRHRRRPGLDDGRGRLQEVCIRTGGDSLLDPWFRIAQGGLRIGGDGIPPRPRVEGTRRRLRRRRGLQDAQARRRQEKEERPKRRRVPGAPADGPQRGRGVRSRRGDRGRKKPLSRAGRRQRRPHPRQAPPDASPDSLGIRLGRGRRRGQETRHLDACALELDPRDRAPRGGRPGDAGLLRVPGPSRRGAEEGDREEDRPARAAAPAGATGWRPFVA